jgi:hypothetical protein
MGQTRGRARDHGHHAPLVRRGPPVIAVRVLRFTAPNARATSWVMEVANAIGNYRIIDLRPGVYTVTF